MIRMNVRVRSTFHYRDVQSWTYRFANQLFSFVTEVAGTCGQPKHVVKRCLVDNWHPNVPRKRVLTEYARRRDGTTI